jgi:hypothetical protein
MWNGIGRLDMPNDATNDHPNATKLSYLIRRSEI